MRLRGNSSISIIRWFTIILIHVLYCEVNAQNIAGQDNDDKPTAAGYAYSVDVNIFNPYDDDIIDPAYMGNQEVFTMLDSLMRDSSIISHTRRINVVSSSSIEGRLSYNSALSKRRMYSIEAALRSRYDHIADDMWSFDYIPENWSHLRQAVVEDVALPNKEGVLSIIDMENRHPDAREHMLKVLDGGMPWSYIHKEILPSSRGSVSMLFVPMLLMPIAKAEPIVTPQDLPLLDFPEMEPPKYSRPILSIRSNLLLDATSTLNISVEAPITPRWSISAEYVTPWWSSWDSEFTWQIESLYFDLRYWLGSRGSYNTLTGWSVGAYAGSGRCDLQPFTERGVQGEYSDYGLMLSYAHKLGESRHWLMEYSIGLGYVTTHYRHYYTAADTEEYGSIKVHNYPWSEETLRTILPTRIAVTLCYLININGVKRGGVR